MNTTIPPTSLNNSERAVQMPPEVKKRVKEISKRIDGKLHPSPGDIQYLFEVFDEYITHYPPREKLNCNDCRVMVRDFWKREADTWT